MADNKEVQAQVAEAAKASGKKTRTVSYGAATALGGAAMSWSMMNQMNSSMWAYFMTDVALVATAAMATILLVAKILEWVGALIAGVIMEKTILKWGKYGSWCIVCPPGVAICFVLMFTNPFGAIPVLQGIWFGLWYSVMMFFVAFITATQTTMVTLLGSKSREDRAFCATKRAQGSQLGQFLFGLIGMPLLLLLNGGTKDNAFGYPILAILFGVICIVMYRVLYHNIPKGLDTVYETKEERQAAAKSISSNRVGTLEMFKLLFKTPPMLGIILSDTTRLLAQFTLLGTALYIFTYVYGDSSMFAPMMSALGITALLTTFLVEVLIKFIKNRTLYVMGLAIFAIFLVCAYFAPTPLLFAIFIACSYIGIGFANSQGTAMVGDASIYCEWKHKKEVKAFMGAMGALPPKFANIISGAVLGFGLVAIGFVAHTEMSAATLNSLKMIGTVIPAIFLVIGIICFLLLNRLTPDKLKVLNDEVNARREAERAAKAAEAEQSK